MVASIHGNKKRVAAQTTKLYLAGYVLHLQKKQKLAWSANDRASFDAMLIHNSSTYADAVTAQSGKVAINRYLKQLHIGSVFSYVEPAQTTSNDLAAMLRRLANRQAPFTDPKMRKRLLSDMGGQVFRTGIPASVNSLLPQATIQDVIGYAGTVNNDAGIVTTKEGQRFILVIMTKGAMQQDFEIIGDIAHRVTEIVYFKG